MKYFDKDYLQFFKDLAANNNRDWFLANKKRYEEKVKKPFEIFVGDLIKQVAKHDKSVRIEPSEAIFRINRDIRFSKDKTPYKLNASAIISPNGRKDQEDPGIYVELGPEHLGIAGGVYTPTKEGLVKIREHIALNPKNFMKILNDKSFKSIWGDMQGERNKVLLPELKEKAKDCPYLFNKQFYYWAELDSKIIISDKLMDTIMKHYVAAKPMAAYLKKALS